MNVIKERIREHCRWLRSIGLARDRVEKIEDELLRAYDHLAAEGVASDLMGQCGYRAAAERLGVHPVTVYRRAARHVKHLRELQEGAKG
jgi:hypothetical protein